MRTILTVVAAMGAALLLGAAAPPKTSSPVESEALRRKIGGPNAAGVDLFERVRTSPLVARAHVSGAVPGNDTAYKVHIDRWLKGSGATDVVVDFAGQRPATTQGHAEVIFMKPAPPVDAGPTRVDYYAITSPGERYEVRDDETAHIDAAVLDEVAHAPDAQVLSQLVRFSPLIASSAAARLALLAATSTQALDAASASIESADTNPQARTELLSMLGSRVPVATLAKLAGPHNAEVLRIDALLALGRKASNEPATRSDALAALEAQADDSNLAVRLNAGLALANIDSAAALAPLQAVLAGSDQLLRAEAVRGLAQLARSGNAEAYDILGKLTQDANSEVRTRAKNLLNQVGPKPAARRSPAMVFWILSAAVVVVLLGAVAVRRRKTA